MKLFWKIATGAVIGLAVCFLLLLAALIPDRVYYMPRATPPQGITNLQTFLEWKPKPMGAMKVTTTNGIYFQFLGPSGRSLSSGPAAYAFDKTGNYIGWTADCGDIFTPKAVYVPGAIRDTISVEAACSSIRTNMLRQL